MILTQLLKHIEHLEVKNLINQCISLITFDSREASAGALFFALEGTVVDGHNYINAATESGCRAVVCTKLPAELNSEVCYILVADGQKALASAAAQFYCNPSSKLKLVGVTGTNGKTTVATLLYRLFQKLGYKVGLISTVSYFIDTKEIKSTHTTPDVIRLNAMIAEMVAEGCEYCFMEVSSHSVVQKRIEGIDFDGAVFTNLSHDHLDYHKTFSEYIKAKKGFFDSLKKESFALYNADDRNGAVMVQNTKAKSYSYSLRQLADFKTNLVELCFEGTLLQMNNVEVWSKLIGKFNAYNMTAVYATSILLGVDKHVALTTLSTLSNVDGRFDYLRSEEGVTAIVDYAHTPDALANVLSTIADIKGSKGRTICVVGCGGDRDKTKRPEMGAIAVKNADFVIFTSDNPRSEEPGSIIADIEAGVSNPNSYVSIVDRGQAIKMALLTATKDDIVLIAGKGHETYQEVKGVRSHFSDKEEILKVFKN